MNRRTPLILLLAAALAAGIGCSTTVIDPGTQSSATYRWGKRRVLYRVILTMSTCIQYSKIFNSPGNILFVHIL